MEDAKKLTAELDQLKADYTELENIANDKDVQIDNLKKDVEGKCIALDNLNKVVEVHQATAETDAREIKAKSDALELANKKIEALEAKANVSEAGQVAELKKELAEKDSLIGKLTEQVKKYNKNGTVVTPIKGSYKSEVTGKEYGFRDNAISYRSPTGKVKTEELLAKANEKDINAIEEMERLIKMGSGLLVEVED